MDKTNCALSSSKMFSIDSLALKLASVKDNSSSNKHNSQENDIEYNRSQEETMNKNGNIKDDLKFSNTGNVCNDIGLNKIIQEIYERSLLRDKNVNDKIKTLADVVTRTVESVQNQETAPTKQSLSPTSNFGSCDEDEANVLFNQMDESPEIGNEIDESSDDHIEKSLNEENETICEMGSESPDENIPESFGVIRVPNRPDIMEEKYEYFSRNVDIFVNRDIPKLKASQTSKQQNENDESHDSSTFDEYPEMDESKSETDENLTKMGNPKSFACEICNRRFSQNGHLNRHMRIHTGDKPFQCDICGKEFSQSGDKNRHERTHSTYRPYKCFICDKEFNQSGHLQRHLRVHAGHILYKNGEFDKELTRKKYEEEREASKDKTKKCPLCDKTFIKKYLLERHIRSHTGETPYKCGECGKGFTRKDRLHTHTRIHTGEKPYSCKECGKGFNQSSHLKTHIRIHTGDRPYKCGICGRGFAQSHDRKKHVRVHTGERPYICPLCGKDFNDNSQLWRHARTHDDFDQSEGTLYKCQICDTEYEYSSQLLQHMKEHTNRSSGNFQEPNLNENFGDSEIDEVRMTAEALIKNTLTRSGNVIGGDEPMETQFDDYEDELNQIPEVKVETGSSISGDDNTNDDMPQMYLQENNKYTF